nr:hypothetical protein L204_02489 [Cryptococcus depauperatus CBS 7855]
MAPRKSSLIKITASSDSHVVSTDKGHSMMKRGRKSDPEDNFLSQEGESEVDDMSKIENNTSGARHQPIELTKKSRSSVPSRSVSNESSEVTSEATSEPPGKPEYNIHAANSQAGEIKQHRPSEKRIRKASDKRSLQNKAAQKKYRDKKKNLAFRTHDFAVDMCRLCATLSGDKGKVFKQIYQDYVADLDGMYPTLGISRILIASVDMDINYKDLFLSQSGVKL